MITLKEAYVKVEANYPLLLNKGLLNEASKTNIDIIKKGKLPTISLNGTGQLQSENLNFGMAGGPVNIDLPLESYKGHVDVNYNIYDGGLTKARQHIEVASLEVHQQELNVSLRNLKDRVNALFFVIKLSRQHQSLLHTSIHDISTNIESLQVGFDNGTVLESELSKLKVRKLELESEDGRLTGDIKAYLGVLNTLLGTNLSEDTILQIPEMVLMDNLPNISRPEQVYYDSKKKLLQAQGKTINANRKPKVSLFAQGGVGYPNPVNFSDVSNATYALGGVRLNWNILDWGKAKKEREKIDIQVKQVQVNKETFEFNIVSQQKEYQEKIVALEEQVKKDNQIAALQKDILAQIQVQLQEGVIKANDYLIQINAELSARQQLKLHQIQIQQLQVNYLTLFGKL
ncbi:TolC family protein [Flavivirga aquimarina]|uniref:TolC family protein n=1 Tax=Flavivirga aquimarina TaxID=2027862 RepID=A0ABT8WAL7_9FLAO|nr:TolC family protein [Flavivirga aquimarina]MDO5970141.1 TolC family protein [Flavivirga aquimarina]